MAAALYAINVPLSKVLLRSVRPTMMAALLYLGAGVGLSIYGQVSKEKGEMLTRAELPYIIGMIVLDIAAPILLMLGLQYTGSANASLLNNFEIVATSLIAFFLFREELCDLIWIPVVTLLGFVAYGLSINFYIKAQKDLGAAKTSAYYSIAPFLGVLFGVLLLQESLGVRFLIGLAIMEVATVLMVKDSISLQHTHEHTHTHTHEHPMVICVTAMSIPMSTAIAISMARTSLPIVIATTSSRGMFTPMGRLDKRDTRSQ